MHPMNGRRRPYLIGRKRSTRPSLRAVPARANSFLKTEPRQCHGQLWSPFWHPLPLLQSRVPLEIERPFHRADAQGRCSCRTLSVRFRAAQPAWSQDGSGSRAEVRVKPDPARSGRSSTVDLGIHRQRISSREAIFGSPRRPRSARRRQTSVGSSASSCANCSGSPSVLPMLRSSASFVG